MKGYELNDRLLVDIGETELHGVYLGVQMTLDSDPKIVVYIKEYKDIYFVQQSKVRKEESGDGDTGY